MTIRSGTAISIAAAALLFGATYSHAQSDALVHSSAAREHSSSFQIPKSMEMEHEAVHSHLSELTKAGDRIGEAAQKLASVLDPHFQKENQDALPPLGLLVQLAEGKFDCGMTAVLSMTDRLQADMPNMLAEHRGIRAATSQLRDAATSENRSEGVKFADELGLRLIKSTTR